MIIYRSFNIPLNCFYRILGHTLSMLIRITEPILRYAIILFCCPSPPLHSLGIVLRNTLAQTICKTKHTLGIRISLFCRLSIPLLRL